MPHAHHVHSAAKDKPREKMTTVLREICNRNFVVITLINFLVMATYYMVFIISTSYAQEKFSLNLSNAGLTASLMVIGCLIGRFTSGNLITFWGCKILLLTGLLVDVLSIFSSFFIDSVFTLFVQRLCSGMGMGIVATATGTAIAYIIPQKYHGFGISIFSISTVLALALGPFFGIFLLKYLAYLDIIKINGTCIIGCIAVFFLLQQIPYTAKRHRPLLELNSYIDPRVVRFSLVALLMCLSYGCIQAFMTTYASERDLINASSLFFLFYALSAMLTRPVSGTLYDTRGENSIFTGIFILTAIALCLLASAHNSFTLLLAGVLFGVGFGNFQSLGQVVSLSLVTKSRFPQATSTFFVFFDLGVGLGPYLFGFTVQYAGYTGMFLLLACTTFCAAVLYYFMHGKNVKSV